jgi:uncharacterized protein YndB with AHSA1/START domain
VRLPVVVALALGGCILPGGASPRDGGHCARVFHTETVIAAPLDRVWSVLVDLPAYQVWNPWLTSAEGTVAPGGGVRARVILGDEVRSADHVVLAVEPGKRLCWRDAGWTTLFVYGQRCRWIEPLPDGRVHFVQELLLDGAFVALAGWMYGDALEAGMAAETAALRQRAELF